jgi:shikimate 5-dehydrogenase
MPVMTPLLEAAKAKGCRIQTGVEMFNAQVDFISEFLLGKR